MNIKKLIKRGRIADPAAVEEAPEAKKAPKKKTSKKKK